MLDRDLDFDLIFLSDDAAQVKVFGFLQALSWVHRKRHIARLIPLTDSQRQAFEDARDAI